MNRRFFVSIVGIAVIAIAVVSIAMCMSINRNPGPGIYGNNTFVDGLKHFSSYAEMEKFVNVSTNSYGGYYGGRGEVFSAMPTSVLADSASGSGAMKSSGGGASDYSQTNIQVAGVDEPDIVKNDGKYIYTLSGGKLRIVEAYPAEEMKLVYSMNDSEYVSNIFVNGDRMVLFSNGYEYIGRACPMYEYANGGVAFKTMAVDSSMPYYGGCGYSKETTKIHVYDIKDRANPVLEYNLTVDGNYVDARMIDSYVYLVSSKSIYRDYIEPPIYLMNGVRTETMPADIYYFDSSEDNQVFTSISALNLENGDFEKAVYLTGSTGTIFMSEKNIYLSYTEWTSQKYSLDKFVEVVALPLLPTNLDDEVNQVMGSDKNVWEKRNTIYNLISDYSSSLTGNDKGKFDAKYQQLLDDYQTDLARQSEKTIIHKISVNGLGINYEGVGEVTGTILNQFSMDEYKGNFRIATTSGQSGNVESINNLFVLDENLKVVGELGGIAEGERIYSVRFMGDRAYVVTFKTVDPLFVIDLKDAENPKVLGYLKIPGYSDYLHPYDENHVIGFGKEVNESIDADKVHSANAVYYTAIGGVKVSIFDVSDVEHPIESAKIVIGDRGTDSAALYDHKAFLFDKAKGILVVPINLVEMDKSNPNDYGQQTWQGAYVLNINLNEISVRGRVTHRLDKDKICNSYGGGQEYCYWNGNNDITRALYMDNNLYTISDGKIMANDLVSLAEIDSVNLPQEQYGGPYYGRDYASGGMMV